VDRLRTEATEAHQPLVLALRELFDGATAGIRSCADGSTATAMTGTFWLRE